MRERFARRWVSALQNGSCASEMKPELVTKALVSGVFIAIKSSRVDSLDVQQKLCIMLKFMSHFTLKNDVDIQVAIHDMCRTVIVHALNQYRVPLAIFIYDVHGHPTQSLPRGGVASHMSKMPK